MGKRERERIQRIITGKEQSIRAQADDTGKVSISTRLKHWLFRVLKRKSLKAEAVKQLSKGSMQDQIGRAHEALCQSPKARNKAKQALMKNAVTEMDKGIKRLKKEGKEPTVILLLEEYDKEIAFQKLCEKVGLNRDWFVNLAEGKIKYQGGL